MKLTQVIIKELANQIYDWLAIHEMNDALCIYYGDERINTYDGEKRIDKNVHANEYCEYAPYNNIITITSEGTLYEYYNTTYDMPKELEDIWKKMGLICEAGESWNWTLYPNDSELEIEYPNRPQMPREPIYIFYGCREKLGKKYPEELDTVMEQWYNLGNEYGKKHGEQGYNVIGQFMGFDYQGVKYHMCPITGYQTESTWIPYIKIIQRYLEALGATNIEWHCGRLD